jgi:hypothetical protein
MTPAEAARLAVTETQARWDAGYEERERRARERDGMTGDAYIARFDDPDKEPLRI